MSSRPAYSALAILACLILAPALHAEDDDVVKVFILAGQSNMEGKAANALLEHQAKDEKTKELFAHLRDGDEWIVRDDVLIKFLSRHGGLTIGFGSPNKTGVELEFGHMMGDHFEEPVLLIKTAWGGHSLYKNFRPPSAGLPAEEVLQKELEQARERTQSNNEKRNRETPLPEMEDIVGAYGLSYRNMMNEIKETQANYETMFPSLAGKKLEIVGFVWFQGFNDMFGEYAPGEYAANMEMFINDVRRDLGTPDLPFVIGALGQNGSKPANDNMKKIQDAQLAMNDIESFAGNVVAVRTDELADEEAERLFPGWQDHFEEWQKVGSDRPYHYLGSAIWFNRIGKRFGTKMIELLGETE